MPNAKYIQARYLNNDVLNNNKESDEYKDTKSRLNYPNKTSSVPDSARSPDTAIVGSTDAGNVPEGGNAAEVVWRETQRLFEHSEYLFHLMTRVGDTVTSTGVARERWRPHNERLDQDSYNNKTCGLATAPSHVTCSSCPRIRESVNACRANNNKDSNSRHLSLLQKHGDDASGVLVCCCSKCSSVCAANNNNNTNGNSSNCNNNNNNNNSQDVQFSHKKYCCSQQYLKKDNNNTDCRASLASCRNIQHNKKCCVVHTRSYQVKLPKDCPSTCDSLPCNSAADDDVRISASSPRRRRTHRRFGLFGFWKNLNLSKQAWSTKFTLLVFLVATFARFTEGCSSRSTPKPRPHPTSRPNVTFQTYACPPAYAAWYCLNGAICFTLKVGESILYSCECAEGYRGQRCEFKNLDGSYLLEKNASIAGGATFAVVFVVLILFIVYLCKHRDKDKREKKLLHSSMVTSTDGSHKVQMVTTVTTITQPYGNGGQDLERIEILRSSHFTPSMSYKDTDAILGKKISSPCHL